MFLVHIKGEVDFACRGAACVHAVTRKLSPVHLAGQLLQAVLLGPLLDFIQHEGEIACQAGAMGRWQERAECDACHFCSHLVAGAQSSLAVSKPGKLRALEKEGGEPGIPRTL